MKRKIRMTVELTVRDMTQEEWDEADGDGVFREYDLEDAEDGSEAEPDDSLREIVKQMDPQGLKEVIEYALVSEDNPEMFEGSNLFVHTEDVTVTDIAWSGELEE